MLFLGTEKYSDAGSYQKFLTSHAGFGNAYTADDHTNYFFEVADDAFDEALDRFAQFFIAPLFNEEYAGREVKAVDSEHSKNLENDFWRVRQVQRTLYDSSHPINRFSTGNLQTLAGVRQAALRGFYKERYSANRMALALVSKAGLDKMEKEVRDRFDKIPNRDLPKQRYPEIYLRKREGLRLLSVEPVADERALSVEFPLPATRHLYEAKPLQIISFILGHEGEGSLLSLLKAENLATSLSAGHGESTVDYSSLVIRVALTPEGLKNHRRILEQILGVIAALREKGIPQYVFEENRLMAEIDYRYREPGGSGSEAQRMSALMQVFPLEGLPERAFTLKTYDPEAYARLLEAMTPDNMLVTLVAKGVQTDRVEPFYQARYGFQELRGEPYQRLQRARPDPRWHLPAPNPFIPRRLGLGRPEGPLKLAGTTFHLLRKGGVPAEVVEKLEPFRDVVFTSGRALLQQMDEVLAPPERKRYLPEILRDSRALPTHILDSERARVWYLTDWRFRQPKAWMILKIYTRGAFTTPSQAMLAALYEAGFEESLNESGYPIRQAGLEYSLAASKSGFVLRLGGYSANLPDLLDTLTSRLKEMPIDEERFAAIKEATQRELRNARFDQPYQQARYFRGLLLGSPNFTREALQAALAEITLEDVRAYAAGLYGSTYLEGVVVGNLAPATARAAILRTLTHLGGDVLPAGERMRKEVRALPSQANQVFSEKLRINNSFAGFHYQVGETNPRLRGALLIIGRVLGQSFYFNLRTRQQLGYIVFSGMGQMKKTLSLNFLVQSGAYGVDTLLQRVEAYIPQFVSEFKSMSSDEFERLRTAVIDAKLKRASNIGEVAERLNWIAFENDEKFDHVSEDIEAAERISRSQVEAILDRALVADGAKRLVIRLIGDDHTAGRPSGTPIDSPDLIQAAGG
ncbi:MAG: insulinase family protein, partial [SAR324 cluster bacterium]|nr:insulinase family protein [SAR324 cluster bacterium]